MRAPLVRAPSNPDCRYSRVRLVVWIARICQRGTRGRRRIGLQSDSDRDSDALNADPYGNPDCVRQRHSNCHVPHDWHQLDRSERLE